MLRKSLYGNMEAPLTPKMFVPNKLMISMLRATAPLRKKRDITGMNRNQH